MSSKTNGDYRSEGDDEKETSRSKNNLIKYNLEDSNAPPEMKKFLNSWVLENENGENDAYYASYDNLCIHEDMLGDDSRTGAYRKAIVDNKHLFKDKIVLDIGCGTGILSMFAASAGASHVYALDNSNIITLAEKIARTNGMENQITFIRGKAEDIELPVDSVDIIISEWMGYLLLYESMIDTVLICRDKWLKKEGLMFPDRAELMISFIEDAKYKHQKFTFWDNVYGFSYADVKSQVQHDVTVDFVDPKALVSESSCFLDLNLQTCTLKDIEFCSQFSVNTKRKDFIHAAVIWFTVHFSYSHVPCRINTGPHCKATHWKQSVIYLKETIPVMPGENVSGLISVRKSGKNSRNIDVKLSYAIKGKVANIANQCEYRLK